MVVQSEVGDLGAKDDRQILRHRLRDPIHAASSGEPRLLQNF